MVALFFPLKLSRVAFIRGATACSMYNAGWLKFNICVYDKSFMKRVSYV